MKELEISGNWFEWNETFQLGSPKGLRSNEGRHILFGFTVPLSRKEDCGQPASPTCFCKYD